MKRSKRRLVRRFLVQPNEPFRLTDRNPADTAGLDYDKHDAEKLLRKGIARLADLQDRLYAQDRWSVLVVFQAMDAAGKDGTIKHVMSGVNPQGVQVYSFKAPSTEELDHNFLWRMARHLPERGRIGIFNRSHYEEVLVVRVHEEILQAQKLPEGLVTKHIWKERFEDINGFERHLSRNGTAILKFFLHLSRKEQKKRLLARLDDPDKNWKFSEDDLKQRACWRDYMLAYEKMIAATSTPWALWYVVPADNKWFTRLVVAEAIVQAMEDLHLAYPEVSEKKGRELARVRRAIARS